MIRYMKAFAPCLFLGLLSPAAFGQADANSRLGEIIQKQRVNKEVFEDWTRTAMRLSIIIEKTAPADAKALKLAVETAQKAFLTYDMEAIMGSLNKGDPNKAITIGQQVVDKLKEVQEALRPGASDPNRGPAPRLLVAWEDLWNQTQDASLSLGLLIEASRAATQPGGDSDANITYERIEQGQVRLKAKLRGMAKQAILFSLATDANTMQIPDAAVNALEDARDTFLAGHETCMRMPEDIVLHRKKALELLEKASAEMRIVWKKVWEDAKADGRVGQASSPREADELELLLLDQMRIIAQIKKAVAKP